MGGLLHLIQRQGQWVLLYCSSRLVSLALTNLMLHLLQWKENSIFTAANITRRWHVTISCQPDGRPPQPVRPWKSGRVHLAEGSNVVGLELPYSTWFGREIRKFGSGVRKYGKKPLVYQSSLIYQDCTQLLQKFFFKSEGGHSSLTLSDWLHCQ